jgi:hypothetical protein
MTETVPDARALRAAEIAREAGSEGLANVNTKTNLLYKELRMQMDIDINKHKR